MNPVLLVVAGPNGAGKTTVTDRLRRDHWSEGVEYLNPDEVARDRFGSWHDPAAVIAAANWTAARRETLLGARAGLAFETVFSAPDKLDFVRRAVEAGYFVRVFFVGTSTPTINAARVAQRVLLGGHSVPIEKIVARYARSMAHLSAVVAVAQRVYVFDNSIDDVDARLCARTVDGRLRKVYGPLPPWVETALEGVPPHASYEDLRRAGAE
jgi:predicted ABC-type ATPase